MGMTGTTGTTWGGDNGGDHWRPQPWGPSGGYGDDMGMMGTTRG